MAETGNMKELTVVLPEEMADEIMKIMEVTGKDINKTVGEMVRQFTRQYETSEGKFEPVRGICRLRKSYHGEPEEMECIVLSEHTIAGDPYTRVYCNGKIYSVPAYSVERKENIL